MTDDKLNYAIEIRRKTNDLAVTIEWLDKIEEDTNVHKIHDIIVSTGILDFNSLRSLTYDYVIKCRELLKQDLAEAQRTFKEL